MNTKQNHGTQTSVPSIKEEIDDWHRGCIFIFDPDSDGIEIGQGSLAALYHLVDRIQAETRRAMLEEIIVMGDESGDAFIVDGEDWKEYKDIIKKT